MKLPFKVISILTVLIFLARPAFAASKTVTVNSEALIGSVLQLTVSGAENSEVRFGNIRPSATTSTEAGPIRTTINVACNTGQQYQVTQTINGPLENGSGGQITPDHLKFKTFSQKSLGTVVSAPTPVSPSAQTVYISDPQGISDVIDVEYTLTVPPAQAPGDYSALITYTTSAV